jgi:hypothetical protein
MSGPMSGAPQPGMVLHLAEENYKFGVGPLICRVRETIAPVQFDDGQWWHVRGDCANGTAENHGGFLDRELYVRDDRHRGSPAGR